MGDTCARRLKLEIEARLGDAATLTVKTVVEPADELEKLRESANAVPAG